MIFGLTASVWLSIVTDRCRCSHKDVRDARASCSCLELKRGPISGQFFESIGRLLDLSEPENKARGGSTLPNATSKKFKGSFISFRGAPIEREKDLLTLAALPLISKWDPLTPNGDPLNRKLQPRKSKNDQLSLKSEPLAGMEVSLKKLNAALKAGIRQK